MNYAAIANTLSAMAAFIAGLSSGSADGSERNYSPKPEKN